MERLWLRHYPPGVPSEIDATRYPSLVTMFEESFTKFSEREACACMGKSLTYADLEKTSRALAAWLQNVGLKRGARVAIMMPNVLQYPIAIAAILRAGCTVVNVNPLYKPRELEFQLADAGAEAIIVLENFAAVLQEALPSTPVKHVVVASLGDMLGRVKGTLVNAVVRYIKKMVPDYAIPAAIMFNDALATGRKFGFTPAAIEPDDIAFLQYTGGTTGVPKGAMLTHGNMIANLQQVSAWMGSNFAEGAEIRVGLGDAHHVSFSVGSGHRAGNRHDVAATGGAVRRLEGGPNALLKDRRQVRRHRHV